MQELIEKLTEMVNAGTKKSELEEAIGLPLNSLSAVLSGTKSMPDSWIPKIINYLERPIANPDLHPQIVVKSNGTLSLAPSKAQLAVMKTTIDKINEDFGEGSIMCLGDEPIKGIEAISTGIMSLDAALGIGGLPRGRIVEIYGMESSAKTTIATSVIAQAQKLKGKCAIIDTEQAFDPNYAALLGVNPKTLFFSQPDNAEQALEELDRLILSGAYAVIILDSVAALCPKAEMESEMGDSRIGQIARLMSQALRKIVGSANKTNTLVIFINQLRDIIPQGYTYPGMPTEITTGGKALKFYASVRIETKRSAQIKDGDMIIGNKIRAKIIKSKVSPPFKTAEFDIIYGEGIDKVGELIDIACEKNIIQKSGSWYSYNNDKLGQGREALRQLLKDNNGLFQEILSKLKD